MEGLVPLVWEGRESTRRVQARRLALYSNQPGTSLSHRTAPCHVPRVDVTTADGLEANIIGHPCAGVDLAAAPYPYLACALRRYSHPTPSLVCPQRSRLGETRTRHILHKYPLAWHCCGWLNRTLPPSSHLYLSGWYLLGSARYIPNLYFVASPAVLRLGRHEARFSNHGFELARKRQDMVLGSLASRYR